MRAIIRKLQMGHLTCERKDGPIKGFGKLQVRSKAVRAGELTADVGVLVDIEVLIDDMGVHPLFGNRKLNPVRTGHPRKWET